MDALMGLGIKEIIGDKRQIVLDLAKQYGAENVRIFGSVVRGEAESDSDIDLLVHFPEADFFKRMELMHSLEELFNRKIDLISDRALNGFIGPYILKEAQPL